MWKNVSVNVCGTEIFLENLEKYKLEFTNLLSTCQIHRLYTSSFLGIEKQTD